MNVVVISGRLVSDPRISKVGEYDVANFKIAADVPGPGKKVAFVDCQAWGKLASEVVARFGKKGDLVEGNGSLVTGSYDGEKGKVYFVRVNMTTYRLVHQAGHASGQETPQLGNFNTDEYEDTL